MRDAFAIAIFDWAKAIVIRQLASGSKLGEHDVETTKNALLSLPSIVIALIAMVVCPEFLRLIVCNESGVPAAVSKSITEGRPTYGASLIAVT